MGLSVLGKLALVNQASCPNSSCYSVAKSNGIRYPTIKKYNRRVSRGLPLFERNGRPPKLDWTSESAILAFMSESASWNKLDINRMVKEEVKNTARRRYPLFKPPTSTMKISRSSIRRISARLITSFHMFDGNYFQGTGASLE